MGLVVDSTREEKRKMITWLKGILEDEAKFKAALRGLIATAGALAVTLPPGALAGWGKYGTILMALAMFLKAGDKNKGDNP